MVCYNRDKAIAKSDGRHIHRFLYIQNIIKYINVRSIVRFCLYSINRNPSYTCCWDDEDGDFGVWESSPLTSSSEILNSRSSVYLFLFTWRLERRFWWSKEEAQKSQRSVHQLWIGSLSKTFTDHLCIGCSSHLIKKKIMKQTSSKGQIYKRV